ncbi:MAG: hypothetical protein J4N95_01625 [Chloroflexi bacterium]|nr:hypothetical protein [Chloroflexota bacterium]MCI0856435.1 hypothetical protein [Chloroflexota bacterium]MCI0889605.1 hypothetical protein [Chloroflexota bacterium]
MIRAPATPTITGGLLFVVGLLLGTVLVVATLDASWETTALVLGIGLAALVGLSQTCSA